MTKRVLINVYDNNEIIDFSKKLSEIYDFEIFATEKTFNFLSSNGILVEKFDWNKTDFDLVICNFYPLSKFINKEMDEAEVLSHFDTEGLSILQKYSKEYEKTLVITNPKQYENIQEAIKNDSITEEMKKEYAQKALLEICKINSDLINVLDKNNNFITIAEEKSQDLLYGENPYQKAELYSEKSNILDYEITSKKVLSYNNYLDINLATAMVSEFYDVNAAVITRHSMPCAAALGSTLEEAYLKATDCDPVSAYGGVVAFSKIITEKLAKVLSTMFLEIIIAPDFEEEALEILKEKDLKLVKIKTPLKDYKKYLSREIVKTPFGVLVQDVNNTELNKNTFKVVSKKKPTTEMVEDMVFAWKISKYTRSNSAVVVKDMKTVGISQGQSNRIDAIDIALDKACENSKDAILATDGAIATTEGIYDSAQARIAGIIQPAGIKKDKEIIDTVDKYEITMVTTGLRQFKNK